MADGCKTNTANTTYICRTDKNKLCSYLMYDKTPLLLAWFIKMVLRPLRSRTLFVVTTALKRAIKDLK